MRFSFVVPACNVAPYAKEMIASLKAQTYKEFEAIIVSEASTDGTEDILASAIEEDRRFTLVRLPRTGSASVSRNYGIEHARGDYLVFIDGDDRIVPDALEKFAYALDKYGDVDIIAAEYISWRMSSGQMIRCGGECPLKNPGRIISGPEALAEFLANGTWRSATWRNVYRRNLLLPRKDLRQIPGRRHQDDEWTPRAFLAAKTVLVSGILYYYYLKRENSITTSGNIDSVRDCAANFESAISLWNKYPFEGLLARQFAHWQFFVLAKFFSPNWVKAYPRSIRKKEFRKLINRAENRTALRKMFRYASLRDRIFILLLLFWTYGFNCAVIPEKLFRKVYQL